MRQPKITHTLQELIKAGFEVVSTSPLIYLREEKNDIMVYEEVPRANKFALQWYGKFRYAPNMVKHWARSV